MALLMALLTPEFLTRWYLRARGVRVAKHPDGHWFVNKADFDRKFPEL